MLTGVWYDKHGVTNNSFKGSNIEKYPPFNVLIKRKNKNFKMASFIMWKPIEKHIIKGTGEYYKFFSKYNDELAIDVSKYIAQSKDDVIFIDFDHVDRAGHIFGFNPKGKRYVNAIEKVDKYVGLIVESMQKRDGYQNEDWLIVITSDHGGIKRNHGGQSIHEKTIPIILSGSSFKGKKITRKAYLSDIVPTIFHHYKVDIDSTWSLDGLPLEGS
jgi:predicted AlkP superfamily pyrophosphatase or phosphodiesterase